MKKFNFFLKNNIIDNIFIVAGNDSSQISQITEILLNKFFHDAEINIEKINYESVKTRSKVGTEKTTSQKLIIYKKAMIFQNVKNYDIAIEKCEMQTKSKYKLLFILQGGMKNINLKTRGILKSSVKKQIINCCKINTESRISFAKRILRRKKIKFKKKTTKKITNLFKNDTLLIKNELTKITNLIKKQSISIKSIKNITSKTTIYKKNNNLLDMQTRTQEYFRAIIEERKKNKRKTNTKISIDEKINTKNIQNIILLKIKIKKYKNNQINNNILAQYFTQKNIKHKKC